MNSQSDKSNAIQGDSELEELLEEMWEYGFNSNGDFPTEHTSRYARVAEAKAAINNYFASRLEKLLEKKTSWKVKAGWSTPFAVEASVITAEIKRLKEEE